MKRNQSSRISPRKEIINLDIAEEKHKTSTKEIKNKEAILIIDINLPNGRKEKIYFNKSDKPEDV